MELKIPASTATASLLLACGIVLTLESRHATGVSSGSQVSTEVAAAGRVQSRHRPDDAVARQGTAFAGGGVPVHDSRSCAAAAQGALAIAGDRCIPP